ncbi:ABC transporter permease [Coralliovum pocilloporae]|uniref:ABC transporter permease n=1 Tax=Coralliovum pocilloporae TaxID=3066369 RepID=UPI003306A7B3
MTDITSRPPPPAVSTGLTRSKICGIAILAVWALIGAMLIKVLIDGYDVEIYQKYAPRVLTGVLTTLELIIFSISIGFALAIPVTLGRLSENRLIGSLCFAYVYFFRGTPLLAQIFLIYYGAGIFRPELQSVGLWWFFRDAYYCAIFTFSLNTAAYQAEIFRGAIQSVPKGLVEAGKALGLHRVVIFWKIIVPNAAIIALRPFGNEIVLMIKGSALASIITVYDLMGNTRLAYARTFDFQVYLWAALLYLAMVETLRRLWDRLELYLTRHLRRSAD